MASPTTAAATVWPRSAAFQPCSTCRNRPVGSNVVTERSYRRLLRIPRSLPLLLRRRREWAACTLQPLLPINHRRIIQTEKNDENQPTILVDMLAHQCQTTILLSAILEGLSSFVAASARS